MSAESPRDAVHAREQRFHDTLAEQRAREPLEPPRDPDPWEQAIVRGALPIEGARVLELGCGDGELTMQLIDSGASEVTAIDISPGMVDLARRRVEEFRPGARARFEAAPAEDTGLPGESFDIVVGKFVLHHLDLPKAVEELARVMKPGARGVFMETSALNPALRLARRHLTGRFGVRRLGTPDEHPLGRDDLALLSERFRRAEVDFPVFHVLHILDRNVFAFRHARLTKVLYHADQAVVRRLPALGFLSYFLRVRLEK